MANKTPAEIRREKLRNRNKQAVQTREQKGLGRKSILDWSRLVGKKPSSFVARSGKDKKNLIDFLPWVVTQSWYKDLRTHSGLTTNLDVGDWDYKLELPVHQNVGENNDIFLCLRLAFGQKCPDCEKLFEEYEKEDQDAKKISSLNPSWRDWYNVYDYNEEANPDGENQIWENVAYKNFEEEILAEADDGQETVLYSDIEEGKTVEIEGKDKKFGKNPYIVAKKVEFKDRDPYEESIVKETVSLDALVKICTYEEFANARKGVSEDKENDGEEPDKEETPSPTSTRNRRKPPVKEETAKEEPEETEPENETSWKEGDDCPSGLEIGSPDENSNECKSCEEEPFNFCTKLADQKKEEEKKKDPPAEKEEPTTNRRRRRQG
jgi:hypothetical protein